MQGIAHIGFRKSAAVGLAAAVALVVPTTTASGGGYDRAIRGTSTFSGRCQFSGTVRFRPPLKNAPQDITQRVSAPGSCSGTLVDTRGRRHDVANAPVRFVETSHAAGASCGSGTATGSGALVFRYGQLRFRFSERRAAAFPLLTLSGVRAGSATGTATPAATQSPVAALQQCAGSGIKRFSLDGRLATAPTISG